MKKDACIILNIPMNPSAHDQQFDHAYTYLDLKVKATPEGADIKGYLDSNVISSDLNLLTTGQTSA